MYLRIAEPIELWDGTGDDPAADLAAQPDWSLYEVGDLSPITIVASFFGQPRCWIVCRVPPVADPASYVARRARRARESSGCHPDLRTNVVKRLRRVRKDDALLWGEIVAACGNRADSTALIA